MRSSRLSTLPYLVILVAVWAANWPILKLVLADAGPFSFTALRLLGGSAVILGALAASGRAVLPARGTRVKLAVSGITQMGGMLGLSLAGLQFVGAGRAAVLTYTMQLWALPIGALITRRWPRPLAVLGSLVSLAGLLLFFNPALVNWSDPKILYGNAVILAAAISWAVGAVLYRHWNTSSDFWQQTAWQLLMASLPLIAAALWTESDRPIHWTWYLFFALAFNWLPGTAFAYFAWARILTVFPASTAGQAVMMVPILA